jgi:tRNA 5-methylaminomethyl-2-thiouridine biosynthesis bifunctional protein
MQGCDLPERWRGAQAWRILDTDFGDGLHFLSTWHAWRADIHRPRMLHVLAIAPAAIPTEALHQCVADLPDLRPLVEELTAQWFGLLPGFHRIVLNNGQVLLTLCIGSLLAMLREQQFLADAIYLNGSDSATEQPGVWDLWSLKALARCCRRGTALASTGLTTGLRQRLQQCGFEIPASGVHGNYNPRWELKRTRNPWAQRGDTPQTCAVVGAGLAGASVAAALARRGWQVQVLDAAPAAAMGASGLPVGLLVPHGSVDDGPRSRLSRSGVRLTLQQARQFLRLGQDWSPSGVLELRRPGTPGLAPDWPEEGHAWSQAAEAPASHAPWSQGLADDAPAVWHASAAWIKPASLVQAWLDRPGVTFRGEAQVASIRRRGDEWSLFDPDQELLASAAHVVLATANGTPRLLKELELSQPEADSCTARLPALQGIRGLMSWGMQREVDAALFPPFPVNGMGSFISNVPVDGGLAWFAGGSYEPDDRNPASPAEHHQANLARLQGLLPAVGAALLADFETGKVRGWGQTRCTSTDRLPLAGPLTSGDRPTLWASTGMGSRGLSFSVLCAELLAARLNGEPLPIEAGLARFLHTFRSK